MQIRERGTWCYNSRLQVFALLSNSDNLGTVLDPALSYQGISTPVASEMLSAVAREVEL